MSNDRPDRQYLSGKEKRPASYEQAASETTDNQSRPSCGCGRDHSMVSRREVLGATAAAVTASAFSLPAAAEEDDTFTIVHDLHSHSDIGEPGEPNIARYQALVQEQLADRDDVLFMGSGDELGSSLISFFTEGRHKVEFMNDMNLTGVGVGNHDFDYGIDTALEKFGDSEFPWITSNLKTPDGEQLPNTEEYIIEEVNGIRLGVFNVVLDGFHNITDYPDDHIQEDPVRRAEEMTTLLREDENCDVVVLASHVPHETHFEIAETVDGLDAIFGSHSHVTFDDAEIHEGTAISEIGYAYFHLGVMTLDENGDLVDWERIDLVDEEGEPAAIEPDPEFKARLEEQRDAIDEQVSEPVGTTAVELSASGAVNYARESHMGNLITNAMLDFYEEADVAFQNAGGIRTNDAYGPGELTFEDILSINPFDNEIILFDVTGRDIRSALGERGLTDGEEEDSRISHLGNEAPFGAQQGQQVAGIQYEWRGHEEPEVLNVFVNGEPLDDEETYTVATTDFIKDIASGYEAFHQIPDEDIIAESGTRYGPAVGEYISERGSVEPELENRIIRVDETVGEPLDLREDGDAVVATIPHPGDAAAGINDQFRAITRTGAEVTAIDVEAGDEEIDVRFDADEFESVADIEEPHLRIFGTFDPDDEFYDYEDEEGELRQLPVSAAYQDVGFKLRSTVPDEEIGSLLADEDEEPGDDDGEEPGDGDDDGEEPGDGDDDGEEPGDDQTDDVDDDGAGFGLFAGAAGVGGAAYLLSQRLENEESEPTE